MTSRDAAIGVSWGVAAFVCYSLIPIGVRLAGTSMPPIEILFFRNVFGFTVFFAFFAWRGFGNLKTGRFGLHLQRNIVNFAGMWLWFAAVSAMPLGQAVALHFTVPLMVVLLAVMILRERPGPLRWAATLIGFCGGLVILRPGTNAVGLPAMMGLGAAL